MYKKPQKAILTLLRGGGSRSAGEYISFSLKGGKTALTDRKKPKSAYYALAAYVFVIVLAVVLVMLLLYAYVPGLIEALRSGNKGQVEAFFREQEGTRSAVMIWIISYIQVISIIIPRTPVYAAAGAVCGTWEGTFLCVTANIAAHMTVFYIARRARNLMQYIAEEHPSFGRALDRFKFRRYRTYYICMAVLVPGVPNWIIPYAAANSRMEPGMYLIALIISLPLPIFFVCLAADLLVHSDILFSVITVGILYLIVGILFLVRNKLPDKLRRMYEREDK